MKLVNKLVRLAIALIEILLILRFVLKLLGASAVSPAVNWLYSVSYVLVQPFVAILPMPTAVDGRFVIEFSTLFAIFAYAVIGYVVQEALGLLLKK